MIFIIYRMFTILQAFPSYNRNIGFSLFYESDELIALFEDIIKSSLRSELINFDMEVIRLNKNPDIDILNTVYQATSMGSLAIEGLLERADDDNFKKALADQLLTYHKIETETRDRLHQLNEKPEDVGIMKETMGRIGIRMNSAIDRTTSHFAEMVIEGSTMGITDLQGILNSNRTASEDTQRLCSSLIHQEQHHIDRMKGFLGHAPS